MTVDIFLVRIGVDLIASAEILNIQKSKVLISRVICRIELDQVDGLRRNEIPVIEMERDGDRMGE